MSTAHRRAEFFALEAREYLAELEPVLSADSRTSSGWCAGRGRFAGRR